ncbi:radical SAM/SPASM domain-containing protein [Velocimicrobium porci]|uniref:Radical SAM protein n=1 Tax=Velocimicrobium porci TaxID=2606634 RepID=A0A6L5Y0V7_9FIRM|nr:radical SAM protein [Velocimicrobium porci]MSS64756.1 radical SAM protein [Velocimicrobium porci]
MQFNRNVVVLTYKNKVVLANAYNGYWIRLTKEVYSYFSDAIRKKIDKNIFIEQFQDFNDQQYINSIHNKMIKLGIIGNYNNKRKKEVSFEITNRCNLRCKHCCIMANSIQEELTTNEVYSAFNKVIKWNPDNITISGGEPLLRQDIQELLLYLREYYNGKITLSTNALLIDEDNIEVLKKCVDYIEISIDGVDEKSCREIRGEGVFEHVIQKVRFLQNNDCNNISLSMVVSDKNIELERSFKKLNEQLGTYPVIRVLAFVGRSKEERAKLSNLKQNEVYIPEVFFDDKQPFVFWGNCLLKNSKRMIRTNGNILSCPLIVEDEYSIANIKDVLSLDQLNNSKMYALKENLLQTNSFCQDCAVKSFCWNCLATIKEYTENNSMKDYCQKVKNYYFKIVWGEDKIC